MIRRFKIDKSDGYHTTFNKCSDKIASVDAYAECLWNQLDRAKKTEAKPEVVIFVEEEPEPPPPVVEAPVEMPTIKPDPPKKAGAQTVILSLVFIFISMLI